MVVGMVAPLGMWNETLRSITLGGASPCAGGFCEESAGSFFAIGVEGIKPSMPIPGKKPTRP